MMIHGDPEFVLTLHSVIEFIFFSSLSFIYGSFCHNILIDN